MRSPASSLLPVLCLLPLASGTVYAQQTAHQSVQAQVQFAPRTSLTVSSSILQFDHADPSAPSVVTVDFTARARTHRSGEVVLTVEAVRAIDGPGGAADVDAEIAFAGEGDGTRTGALTSSGPSIVGRWVGSGSRDGRIAFSLRAPASGTYTLPVRFVITAP